MRSADGAALSKESLDWHELDMIIRCNGFRTYWNDEGNGYAKRAERRKAVLEMIGKKLVRGPDLAERQWREKAKSQARPRDDGTDDDDDDMMCATINQ